MKLMITCLRKISKMPMILLLVMVAGMSFLLFHVLYLQSHAFYAYSIYSLSAFLCVVIVYRLYFTCTTVCDRIISYPMIQRMHQDSNYRMKLSLYGSVSVNVLYALGKLILGWYNASVWLITIGSMYLLLGIMRALILKHLLSEHKEENREWRVYRNCGFALCLMNITLSGVVILMVVKQESYHYPGYTIYVAAMYAFYCMMIAIINLVKYRKSKKPLILATKYVSFVSALISMLALQTAMFVSFAKHGTKLMQLQMNTTTGIVVCCIIFLLAFYMLQTSTKKLKMIKKETQNEKRRYLIHL